MSYISVRRPEECSDVELDAFVDLVRRGGEIADGHLLRRVRRAETLAFAFVDGNAIGVGAVKRPNRDYQRRIFSEANVEIDSSVVGYELGWIFVCEKYRGKQLSHILVESLLRTVKAELYATSREKNEPMRRTLVHFGFREIGQKYRSKNRPSEYLSLFLKPNL